MKNRMIFETSISLTPVRAVSVFRNGFVPTLFRTLKEGDIFRFDDTPEHIYFACEDARGEPASGIVARPLSGEEIHNLEN